MRVGAVTVVVTMPGLWWKRRNLPRRRQRESNLQIPLMIRRSGRQDQVVPKRKTFPFPDANFTSGSRSFFAPNDAPIDLDAKDSSLSVSLPIKFYAEVAEEIYLRLSLCDH